MHRYHRPAALAATAFGGIKIEQALAYLAPDPQAADMSDVDMETLKAFGIKR